MFGACYLTKGKLAPVIPAVLVEPFVFFFFDKYWLNLLLGVRIPPTATRK